MIILWSIFVAVLSYELIYSDLAFYVKKALFLDKYYAQVELLSSWKFYPKFLGKYLYLLFPLAIMVLILANTHRFLYLLLQCQYCTATQLGFWLALLYLNFQIIPAIGLGLLSNFCVAIYSKIRN